KGGCFTDQESIRRPFTVQVNFTLPKEDADDKSIAEETVSPSPSVNVPSATQEANPQKVGWLGKIGGFFFGSPAMATAPPKGTTETIPIPQIIFPFEKQCVSLGPRFEVVWTEVPDAESYLVELRGRNQFGLVVYIAIAGAAFDSKTKLNRFVDPNPGDGIVQSRTQPTLEAVYTLRVAAVVNGVTGDFSSKQVFSLSSSCPIPPDYEFIDIDFNDDRTFDGKDLFAYAASWYSATTEEKVDERLDLTRDGFVDANDEIFYLTLFRDRAFLPKSPPLDAPEPRAPEEGSQVRFAQTQVNGGVLFNWIPPATTEEAIPYIYEVEINRPDGNSRVFAILNEFVLFHLTVGGNYRWRVRAISDDYTFGSWSSHLA
ncbi:MAG: hypothetical protein KC931_26430, partial [Candidatus Omnitrophica bacterium]|nr:hypothetical protein [Candidatus Omnitrophota bacterium]